MILPVNKLVVSGVLVLCILLGVVFAQRLPGEDDILAQAEAAQKILDMGPSISIIKKGESGSIMCNADGEIFVLPAYPTAEVKDPTGAGDSFAGAFMGYLASMPAAGTADFASLKQAVAYGTVVASFAIANFSLTGLASINKADIDDRFKNLRKLTQF